MLSVAPDAAVAPLSPAAQAAALALVSGAVSSCASGAIPVSPQAVASFGASLSLLAAAAAGSIAQHQAAAGRASPQPLPPPPALPPSSAANADKSLRVASAPSACGALRGVAAVLASFLDSVLDGIDVAGEAPVFVAPPGGLFAASARLVAPSSAGPFAASQRGGSQSAAAPNASFVLMQSQSQSLPAGLATPAARVAVSALAFDPWACVSGSATARLSLASGGAPAADAPFVFGSIPIGASATAAAAANPSGVTLGCASYNAATQSYDPSLCAALLNPAPVGATFSWAPPSNSVVSNATLSVLGLGWTASGTAFDGCELLTLDCSSGDTALVIATPSSPSPLNFSLACAPGRGGRLVAWSGASCAVAAAAHPSSGPASAAASAAASPCAWDAAWQRFSGPGCVVRPVLDVASRGAGDFIATKVLASSPSGVLLIVPPSSSAAADRGVMSNLSAALPPPTPQPRGAPRSRTIGEDARKAAAAAEAPIAVAAALFLLLLLVFGCRRRRRAAAAAVPPGRATEWAVVPPPDGESAPPHARRCAAPSPGLAGGSVAERLLALSGVSQPLVAQLHVGGGHHHFFPPPLPPAADGPAGHGGGGGGAGWTAAVSSIAAATTTPRARRGSARELARLSSLGRTHKRAGWDG